MTPAHAHPGRALRDRYGGVIPTIDRAGGGMATKAPRDHAMSIGMRNGITGFGGMTNNPAEFAALLARHFHDVLVGDLPEDVEIKVGPGRGRATYELHFYWDANGDDAGLYMVNSAHSREEFLRWYRRLACCLVERPWLIRVIATESAEWGCTRNRTGTGNFELDEELRPV